MKRDKLIQTGKVLVTCTLTITGLGCHTGSGEEWADEENALTAAEAQAFKRSCVCFGLGRYLYNLAEIWVPLNEHRRPSEYPKLPQWALPKGNVPAKSHPASGSRPPVMRRGPIDQKATVRIEGFRRMLGDAIYKEILWRVAHARHANDIPNAQLQANVAEAKFRQQTWQILSILRIKTTRRSRWCAIVGIAKRFPRLASFARHQLHTSWDIRSSPPSGAGR